MQQTTVRELWNNSVYDSIPNYLDFERILRTLFNTNQINHSTEVFINPNYGYSLKIDIQNGETLNPRELVDEPKPGIIPVFWRFWSKLFSSAPREKGWQLAWKQRMDVVGRSTIEYTFDLWNFRTTINEGYKDYVRTLDVSIVGFYSPLEDRLYCKKVYFYRL